MNSKLLELFELLDDSSVELFFFCLSFFCLSSFYLSSFYVDSIDLSSVGFYSTIL